MNKIKTTIIFLVLTLVISGCVTTSKQITSSEKKSFTTVEVGDIRKMPISEFHKNRIAAFNQENLASLQNGTVFLGDSLTEGFDLNKYFPGKKAINRGMSGDTLGGALRCGCYDRLSSCVYNLNPDQVVMMIGINDLSYFRQDTTFRTKLDQYDNLANAIRKGLPNKKLFFVSVLPTRDKWAFANRNIIILNEHIQRAAKRNNAIYLDAHSQLKDSKGELKEEYSKDGLHLTEAGYTALANFYKPQVFGEK